MDNLLPPKTPDPLAPDAAPPTRPWQFGLRHLLGVMAAVCVVGAGYQWMGVEVLLLAGIVLFIVLVAFAVSLGKWLEGLVALAVVILLIAFALPDVNAPRGGARRSRCQNNLRQISIALQNYHDVYKSFPPAYVADDTGKPLHSWRVLILPFLEHKPLYDVYRFDEPWDGPNNRQLAATTLKLFECPSDENAGTGQTSYVAVVGPGTAWPGAKSINLSDIKDGSSNTIHVVEVHHSGIHWMEPRDLDVSQMPMTINAKPATKGANLGISSGHPGVAQAARMDGSIFAIIDDTPPATLRAMLTIAGGEQVEGP